MWSLGTAAPPLPSPPEGENLFEGSEHKQQLDESCCGCCAGTELVWWVHLVAGAPLISTETSVITRVPAPSDQTLILEGEGFVTLPRNSFKSGIGEEKNAG